MKIKSISIFLVLAIVLPDLLLPNQVLAVPAANNVGYSKGNLTLQVKPANAIAAGSEEETVFKGFDAKVKKKKVAKGVAFVNPDSDIRFRQGNGYSAIIQLPDSFKGLNYANCAGLGDGEDQSEDNLQDVNIAINFGAQEADFLDVVDFATASNVTNTIVFPLVFIEIKKVQKGAKCKITLAGNFNDPANLNKGGSFKFERIIGGGSGTPDQQLVNEINGLDADIGLLLDDINIINLEACPELREKINKKFGNAQVKLIAAALAQVIFGENAAKDGLVTKANKAIKKLKVIKAQLVVLINRMRKFVDKNFPLLCACGKEQEELDAQVTKLNKSKDQISNFDPDFCDDLIDQFQSDTAPNIDDIVALIDEADLSIADVQDAIQNGECAAAALSVDDLKNDTRDIDDEVENLLDAMQGELDNVCEEQEEEEEGDPVIDGDGSFEPNAAGVERGFTAVKNVSAEWDLTAGPGFNLGNSITRDSNQNSFLISFTVKDPVNKLLWRFEGRKGGALGNQIAQTPFAFDPNAAVNTFKTGVRACDLDAGGKLNVADHIGRWQQEVVDEQGKEILVSVPVYAENLELELTKVAKNLFEAVIKKATFTIADSKFTTMQCPITGSADKDRQLFEPTEKLSSFEATDIKINGQIGLGCTLDNDPVCQ